MLYCGKNIDAIYCTKEAPELTECSHVPDEYSSPHEKTWVKSTVKYQDVWNIYVVQGTQGVADLLASDPAYYTKMNVSLTAGHKK